MSAVTVAPWRGTLIRAGVDRQERRAGHVSVQTWPMVTSASAPVGAALRCGGSAPRCCSKKASDELHNCRAASRGNLGPSSLKKACSARVHDHLGVLAEARRPLASSAACSA